MKLCIFQCQVVYQALVQTAIMLSDDKPYRNRVFVVNNKRISSTLAQSAIDAVELAKRGWSAAQIKKILEQTCHDSTIYITLDTLKYLKKADELRQRRPHLVQF